VGFSDVYARYDYALSLHTKKSPHGGGHLAPWRDYLYDHLVGSAKAIQSIFDVLASDRVGFVFPQHYFPLRRYMAWGDNFSLAQKLLERQGVDLTREMELECPSGSMFWCRTDALRGLLDMKLQFEDFPEENGQVDGTMAHAIERSFLYSAEARGYSWAKVTLPDRYPLRDTVLRISDQRSIAAALKRVWRPLLKSDDSAKVQSFRFD
jgi:lipopolysaccharide biosynthesis protein